MSDLAILHRVAAGSCILRSGQVVIKRQWIWWSDVCLQIHLSVRPLRPLHTNFVWSNRTSYWSRVLYVLNLYKRGWQTHVWEGEVYTCALRVCGQKLQHVSEFWRSHTQWRKMMGNARHKPRKTLSLPRVWNLHADPYADWTTMRDELSIPGLWDVVSCYHLYAFSLQVT